MSNRVMKDSGVEWIGDIPENWEMSRFKYFYSVNKAKLPKTLFETLDSGMRVYMSIDYIRNPNDCLPQYAKDGSICSKDDALLLWDGSNAGEIIHVHPEGYAPSTTAILTLTKSLDKKLGVYFLKFLEQQIRENVNGMGVPHVDGIFLKNLPFVIPSSDEQSRIADFLDGKCAEIDGLVGDIQEQIEVLEQYKKSVITEAVTQGVEPGVPMKDSGIEWIGSICADWSIAPVKYLFDITLGKMVDSKHYEDEQLDNYLCAANIKWLGIDTTVHKRMHFSEEEKRQYLLQLGDVLIMEGGTSGTTCVYNGEFAPCFIQNSVLRCRPKKNNVAKLLYYWNYIVFHSGYINSICNRATITHYTKEKVEETPMVMIPPEEQRLIVEYLDAKCAEIDAVIGAKREQVEVLGEYKKSLIYEYVTGKKEVPEGCECEEKYI